MDLKKFLDQTVREVKREVNKKVLKVPEIEQKVYEATSNEPWGPHGTLMGDIAQATRNFNEYQMIMAIVWKRLNDTGKNWRHVYKSLTVLEFLVANGAERIIDELREHAYQVQTLCDFQYVEPGGKDQGINVRKKAQSLVGLLSDKDKIREVRSKAAANRDKYRGVSSTGSFSKSSSYSSTGGGYGGGYGDRDQDDDRYGGGSRTASRDDDRYGDRDRDDRYRDDRYRDDDRSRDSSGDRYRDDNRDRDRFDDDRYGAKAGDGFNNDKYGDDIKNEGSGSGFGKDREQDRSFEDDERYPARRGNGTGSGSKADEYAHDDREPSSLAAAVARAHNSQSNLSQSSSNASQVAAEKRTTASVGGSYFASMPAAEDFDDFDPRGSFSATSAAPRDDPFGTSSSGSAPAPAPALAPVSVPAPLVKSTSGIEDLFGDSSFDMSFNAVSAPVSNTAVQGNGLQSEDLFGSPAFTAAAAPQQSTTSFLAPPPQFLPAMPPQNVPNGNNMSAFQMANLDEPNTSFGTSSFSAAAAAQPSTTSFLAPNAPQFPPAMPPNNVPNGNSMLAFPISSFDEPNTSFGTSSFSAGVPTSSASTPPQTSFLPGPPAPPTTSSYSSYQTPPGPAQAPSFPLKSGSSSHLPFAQVPVGGNSFGSGLNASSMSSQGHLNNMTTAPPPKSLQKSFQTKSAIWADTISSGLVDLNISGPKTNPLAELGIDLKDSIFSAQEKRKEEKAQPTASNMGRAMGSGTGLGLAGAGGIAPPPAPSMMGGMNMGMGMRQPSMGMGMGMGVNMGYMGTPGLVPNQGYGATPGIGVNPGYGVSPGMDMAPGMMNQGMGVNPGMGRYGAGMGMVQGGYGPGLGMGGHPNQQYSGYR